MIHEQDAEAAKKALEGQIVKTVEIDRYTVVITTLDGKRVTIGDPNGEWIEDLVVEYSDGHGGWTK